MITRLLRPLLRLFQQDATTRELLESNSRKVIWTMGGVYLAWHFIATLSWPEIFSPSLWLLSGVVLFTVVVSLRLLARAFAAAQGVWFVGVAAAILGAYGLYQWPELLLALAALPLMAQVMMGVRGAVVVSAAALGIVLVLPLGAGFQVGLFLAVAAAFFLGWGVSSNLISAIEASSYHYNEAVLRLEETRQHRAQISVLLREQTKANYQLERMNRMLAYARAKADEAREDRDRFTLAVSHELRSPLNFILGFSDLMVNSPETYAGRESWPPGLYDDVQEIYRSSTHLLGLINDILDMGKMDAHQMVLFKEKARIEDILNAVREMVESPVRSKGLVLRLELAPDLPELYVDCTRIRQVVLNLVTNAMRFTERGGITIRAALAGEMLRVEVEDSGLGIPPEDLERVFDEFLQAGSESWRRGQGTGLGLSIARRFIELHGGTIGASSQPGQGSLFYFTLPVQAPLEEESAPLPAAAVSPAGEPPAQRAVDDPDRLVLVLASDERQARTLREALSGYAVTSLLDPEGLLAAVNQWYPRALVVDRAMAMRAEVQQALKSLPYDLPVFKVTLMGGGLAGHDLPAGVLRYLVKPVTRAALWEAVSALGAELRTLLVVDDDPSMVRYLTQTLKASAASAPEFTFLPAHTGGEAVAQLQGGQVDAVLLDLDLPDMNGFAVLDFIQSLPEDKRPQTLIISANDLEQMLAAHRQGSLEVWLRRPFTRDEGQHLLHGALDAVRPQFIESKNGGAAGSREDPSESPAS